MLSLNHSRLYILISVVWGVGFFFRNGGLIPNERKRVVSVLLTILIIEKLPGKHMFPACFICSRIS